MAAVSAAALEAASAVAAAVAANLKRRDGGGGDVKATTSECFTWRNPVRVASPTRINLEEPGQGGQPT